MTTWWRARRLADWQQRAALWEEQGRPAEHVAALADLSDKLSYLLQQQAIASDPAQKFSLGKEIEATRAQIQDLGG